jgi:hypothetical protein
MEHEPSHSYRQMTSPRMEVIGIQLWDIFVMIILFGGILFTRTVRYVCFRAVTPSGNILFVTRIVMIDDEQSNFRWIPPEEVYEFLEMCNRSDYRRGSTIHTPLHYSSGDASWMVDRPKKLRWMTMMMSLCLLL